MLAILKNFLRENFLNDFKFISCKQVNILVEEYHFHMCSSKPNFELCLWFLRLLLTISLKILIVKIVTQTHDYTS